MLLGKRFGPFDLNPSTGELRKHGIPLKLPNQAFQLLWLLTDRVGDLVTREEIRVALWPNETVVEWEHSINTAVKRIRAALGDDIAKPVYVETLRGRGYRFVGSVEAFQIADVRRSPAPPEAVSSTVSDTPAPQAVIGRGVSRYRVLKVIGRGGMGIVYKAEDLRLGRQVALKFLPLERVADPVAVARFEREARTASMLNHPNICTIYDVELETSGAFIAMELLEGETLKDRLDNTATPFSTLQLIDLAVQIADALEAAHGRSIIHRDIKPANIFLTRSGEPKVLDFGLAKPAPRRLPNAGSPAGGSKRESSGDLTEIGAAPGTTAYMSPEQARSEELDARTDLYSFGALLYEAATGRQSFRDGAVSILPPEDAGRRPQKLWEIIARLLEPDRELRYQTAGDVASEFRRLKRDTSATAAAVPRLPAEVDDIPPLPQGTGSRWIIYASLAGVSVLVLTLFVWKVLGPGRPPGPLPLPEILTSDPGNQVAGDFSPDGKQVVYCWNGFDESNYDLYAMTIGGGRPRRLTTGADVEYSPAWSPDGKLIAFLKGPAGGVAALMLMPALGGPARKLCDTSMSVAPNYRRIEWSPDSRWIVMEGEPSSDQNYALTAVSVSDGERHPLTFPGPNQGDLQPAFSTDGRTLAFVKDVGNGVSRLFLLAVSAEMTARGSPRPLRFPAFEKFNMTSPRWISGGREVIFTSNRGGSGRLWRAPVEGTSEPVILSSMGEHSSFPAVSRDGNRLLFSRNWVEANIWLAPAKGPAADPPKLVATTPTDSMPDFSPDGDRIAFDSERSGSTEIWVSDRTGASPLQLTHYGGPVTGSARWSPDGKWIAYDSRSEGQPDIYVIPAAGGTAQRLTKDPAADVMPFWSPDGRWIYFCSARSGSRQVWRIPPHGGLEEQITRTGGCAPRITLDGNTIYYMKQSGPIASIWTAPADGGEEMLVLNNVVDRCFALSHGRLYYVAQPPDDAHLSLRSMDLRTRKVEVVRTITGRVSPTIAISPDGTAVLYRQVDRQGSNLMLVDNFY